MRVCLGLVGFHLATCLVIIFASPLFAIYTFIGLGYAGIIKAFALVPVLLVPLCLAGLAFCIWLRWSRTKPAWSALLAGPVSILTFFTAGEITMRPIIHNSAYHLGNEGCLFDVQSFTASTFDKIGAVDLFDEGRRTSGHALLAFPDGTIQTWSYFDMSFSVIRPGLVSVRKVPSRCSAQAD